MRRSARAACPALLAALLSLPGWALAAGTLAALSLACGEAAEEGEVEVGTFIEDEKPAIPVPSATGPRDVAVLEVEGRGTIRFELLPELAPEAVEAFTALVEADHYDGTTFHRVLPGYMIQGGDPNSRDRDPRNDGQGDRHTRIPDEFTDTSHLPGIVSFAHRGREGTADGQFFIMVGENRDIDGAYTVFGRVLEGQDVANQISKVERDKYERWGPADRPLEDVVITDVRIERGAGGTAWKGGGDEKAEAAEAAEDDDATELSTGSEWSS